MSLPGASPTTDDRLLTAFRELVREQFPALAYAGVYEYAVQVVAGSTVQLLPTASIGLSMLPPLTFPLAAYTATGKTPTVGATVLVGFINADPARPVLLPRVGDVVMGGKLTVTASGTNAVLIAYVAADGTSDTVTLTFASSSPVTIAPATMAPSVIGKIGVGNG